MDKITIFALSFILASFNLLVGQPSLITDTKNRVEVMVLGTFHFENPGLDSYVSEEVPDVFDEIRQAEISNILDMLAKFKPDKIALEYKSQYDEIMNDRYHQYLKGQYQLGRDERYQLGFRLGQKLNIGRMVGIDAPKRNYESFSKMSNDEFAANEQQLINEAFAKMPWAKLWYPEYEQLFQYEDSLSLAWTLPEYFLWMNSDENITMGHGIYLVDDFKLGIGASEEDNRYFGADMRTSWYNRNLRIFQNIIRMMDGSEERILVIIGAGHLPILKHCIETSPEFEWVPVEDYLRP